MKRIVVLVAIGVGVAAVLWGATSIKTEGDVEANAFIGDGSQLTTGDRAMTPLKQRFAAAETLVLAIQDRLRDGIRFEDKGDGTVLDRNTGLFWLKNANCDGHKDWQNALDWAALLAAGQCGLTDGSTEGQWRVPTIEEFCSRGEDTGICPASSAVDSLVNSDFNDPSVSNRYGIGPCTTPGGCAFSGVESSFYWSSSVPTSDTGFAWWVSMSLGVTGADDKTSPNLFVWPVRGGQ